MIRTLRLENYRSFEEYALRDLAKVNLLVGPNNCGKTSILEAVHLLASRGNPLVLTNSATRRGELDFRVDDQGRRSSLTPLHHHFHGHQLAPGTYFAITSNDGLGSVRMQIEEAEDDQTLDIFEIETATATPLALRICRGDDKDVAVSLTEDGSLEWGFVTRRRRALESIGKPLPATFVTAESLYAREMAAAWDQVVIQGRKSEVVEAMRILQKDLRSIDFLTGDRGARTPSTAGIVLGFQAGSPPVPIGSYGDGMRRLLALSLSLVRAAHGFLLIDEIDTGLHWTVMEEMWKLVVDNALRSSIQIFATTHSHDCIIGLASLLRTRPDLWEAVSVQKIERGLVRSVSFDAEAIIAADDLSIELR